MMDSNEVATSTGAHSFEVFFELEYPRLVRLLYAMTTDLGEAEDVAQEAMLRVYERWDRVKDMESPAAFAYTVGLNVERKRIRHLQVRARRAFLERKTEPMEPHVPGEIVSALASLPHGQRAALLLVEWLGLSAEEAGPVLGISPSSVRSRIHRARSVLKHTLGSDDDV